MCLCGICIISMRREGEQEQTNARQTAHTYTHSKKLPHGIRRLESLLIWPTSSSSIPLYTCFNVFSLLPLLTIVFLMHIINKKASFLSWSFLRHATVHTRFRLPSVHRTWLPSSTTTSTFIEKASRQCLASSSSQEYKTLQIIASHFLIHFFLSLSLTCSFLFVFEKHHTQFFVCGSVCLMASSSS